MKLIEPAPERCHYGRCWCLWWVIPNMNTRPQACPACGVPIVPADDRDFLAADLKVREVTGRQ